MRKILGCLCTLALVVMMVSPAQADKEFIQKVQAIYGKAQEKAKAAQEAIQSNLDEIKKLRESVDDVKGAATEDLAAFNKALDEAENLNLDALENLKQVPSGLESVGTEDPEESVKKVEEVYVPKKGLGNDTETHKKAQNFMQDTMRKATTDLYALGFTTRTTMQKEKPRDPDMTSSDKIAREINFKAAEMMDRLATIYILESQIQNYQYIQAMKVMTIDASATEGEDK